MAKDIRETILKELIHNPKSSFSDLWNKEMPSNEFTYHLNKLIEEGLVQKTEDKKYHLTILGQRLECELDGKTGKKREKPSVALLLVIKRNNQYLLYHRLKEPFYGMYGVPGAKLDFGETILEGAKRELKEETGLIGEGKLIAVNNLLTFEKENLLTHLLMFIVLFENPQGKLEEHGREGEYLFADKIEFEEKHKLNILYPEILKIIDIAEKFNGQLEAYEISIYKEGNTFTKLDFKKI